MLFALLHISMLRRRFLCSLHYLKLLFHILKAFLKFPYDNYRCNLPLKYSLKVSWDGNCQMWLVRDLTAVSNSNT